MNHEDVIIKTILPGAVSVLYLLTAIYYYTKKEWEWAVLWASYALANFALILLSLKK